MGKRKRKVVADVVVKGIAHKGLAIGKSPEGEVYMVEGVIPGDILKIQTTRKKKGIWHAVPVEFKEYSTDRVEPECQHFGVCGGCKWQHFSYEGQLKEKQSIVENALRRIAKVEVDEILPILGSERTYHYRNKLEYTFSNKRWLTEAEINSGEVFDARDALGFHRPGAFDKIVHVNNCRLQDSFSDTIRNAIHTYAKENDLDYFDIRAQKGLLRNLIVRNTTLDEWMVILSFFREEKEKREGLLNHLQTQFPQIDSLQYVINAKKNDTLFDQTFYVYAGKDHIVEQLRDVKFKIGPKSFFQTNSRQAKNLYDVIVDFAALDGSENVYDLYSGLGSIALYVAAQCKHVVGIEEVETAVEDAWANKALNSIENASFYAGDVRTTMEPTFVEEHGKPDLIITDPPRAGMHKDVVDYLLTIHAPRIIYVSCNPATQARDLALLSDKYQVLKSQAVDMFPHTNHVENVVLLKSKSGNG